MYTLDVRQVDLRRRTVFLDKTKNGDKRQVPLTSVAVDAIRRYLKHVKDGTRGMAAWHSAEDRLFPWWDGVHTQKSLRQTTSLVSRQYARIFELADVGDFVFHDLRHDATGRLFERSKLREMEIQQITGHKTLQTLKRYANLRASRFAEALW
jgi:integrase